MITIKDQLSKDGNFLQHIINQSQEMCLIAVNQNAWALQYVKAQTPKVCLAAVRKDGYALSLIDLEIPNIIDQENPKHKTFYDLGWRDGDLYNICLNAVKQNGNALDLVQFKTEEICIAAIKNTGDALMYVEHQTPEICLMAIQQNRQAILYVHDLWSIASLIDESTMQKGLSIGSKDRKEKFKILARIREANTIAKNISQEIGADAYKIKSNRARI